MPIYEYQCEKCQHPLEALQKYSDKPLRECPECGRHALRRLMSAPRFRLAGSGWYETDFKSDNEQKRNLVEKEKGETPAAAPASTTEPAGDKPAAPVKETAKEPAKEATSKEPAGADGSARRRVASKPLTVTKPVAKPKAKPASKPASRKRAVRNR